MTDRERLKEKIDYLQKVFMEDDDYDYFNEFLADRLLADKDIIVPPCKVGDVVYYVHETFYDNEYMKAKEDELDFSHIIKVVERPNCKTNLILEKAQFDWLLMDSWLKGDVFLTKEEAEAELRKRSEYNA